MNIPFDAGRDTRGKVLIVDDQKNSRTLLRALLDQHGHQVIEAENGADGLRVASEQSPDAVLLDLAMPGMDGYEVCRRIKRNPLTAAMPVILVSGHTRREDTLAGIAAGADDFLGKPVDKDEVILRVGNAVKSRRLYGELRRKYEELSELERMRDELTHMIVHDMKSPLTAIQGNLQLITLATGGGAEEQVPEYVRDAQAGCSTLLEMISTLLDVTRLESGKMPLRPSRCDVSALLRDSLRQFRSRARMQVTLDLPEQPVYAVWDADLMRRVVVNLASNALKFSPPGEPVRVALNQAAGHVNLSVTDRGPGIPREDRDRVFEKFAQTGLGREKAYSSGLGLTFCRLAVKAHNGRIGLKSEVGRGSTFWLELPLSREFPLQPS